MGKDLLEGKKVEVTDPEADIDFAVAFLEPPENNLKVYAALSLDIQELVSPHIGGRSHFLSSVLQ